LGVFVRSLGLWKKIARVKKIIFDKTGTLTLENPALMNPEVLAALDADARRALRHLISGNLHPVSRSLFDAIGPGSDDLTETVFEEPGFGLCFKDQQGHEWALGRPAWKGDGSSSDAEFTCNGQRLADFNFTDQLRAESVDEVHQLQQRCMEVFILSGDREGKVQQIARQLSLDQTHWHASMTPESKAAWVREHDAQDTLYAGDGANDSLAFDAALCAGSPVTGRSFLEHKADFYFLGHSLRFISGLLGIAALHRKAVRRVFAFSVSYTVVTAIAGLMGHLSPLAAAVLMPVSSVAT
jgi:Cu2+-exporting ATPase